MGQDISLYPISSLDSEIHVRKNSPSPLGFLCSTLMCFLCMSYFIFEVPKLPFREFAALLPSFFSPCLSLLRFSLRETWKVAVRGLSSSPSTSLLCDLEQVIAFLRYSFPSVLHVLQSAGSWTCMWICHWNCRHLTNANEIQYSAYLCFVPQAIVTYKE